MIQSHGLHCPGPRPKASWYDQYTQSENILFLTVPFKMLILLTLKTSTNSFSHENKDTHFPTKNVTSLFLYVNKDSYVAHASITTKSQGWEDTGYEWVEVE